MPMPRNGETQDSRSGTNTPVVGRIEVYGEPWLADEAGDIRDTLGRKPVLNGVALAVGPRNVAADEWTRRVLACVNACAGIDTADLEAGAVKELALLCRSWLREWLDEEICVNCNTKPHVPGCALVRALVRLDDLLMGGASNGTR
jgi:hypothetical protein